MTAREFIVLLSISLGLDVLIAVALIALPGLVRTVRSNQTPGGVSQNNPHTTPVRAITLTRALPALLLASGIAVVKYAVLAHLYLRFESGAPNLFAHVAYVYAAMVCAVPAFGIVILALSFVRRTTWLMRTFAFVCVLPLGVGVWASLVEPRWIETVHVRVDVPDHRAPDTPVRVAVLADMQTPGIGSYEQSVIDRVRTLAPDLIVIPGDVYQAYGNGHGLSHERFDESRDEFRDALTTLAQVAPTFFTPGNTDMGIDTAALCAGTGAVHLDEGRSHVIDINGARIRLVGVGTAGMYARNTGDVGRSMRRRAGWFDHELVLVLAHSPDFERGLQPNDRPDLIVCGHTHGGQVQVPGIGALVTASVQPRAVASGGLHEIRGNRVYVSRGVGHERNLAPPLRVFCRPELTVLELH